MRAIIFVAGILLSACASSDEPSRTAGEVFRDCRGCPEMVALPSGQFMMGDWYFGYDCHRPVHRESVGDFAIGRYEVTFEEWDACVRDGGCVSNPNPNDQGWGRGRRPVINVSWQDAQEYVQWLSARTGQACRLPSEAEWDYADNAPRYVETPSGRMSSDSTAPVGSYQPNYFGVHDKRGNVREWTEDFWRDAADDSPSNDAAGATTNEYRVLRDVSWQHGRDGASDTDPAPEILDEHSEWIGFRVARVLTGVRNPNPLPAPLAGSLEPPLEGTYYAYSGTSGCGDNQNHVTLTRDVTLHASRDPATPVVATVRSGEAVSIIDCRVLLLPQRGDVLRTDYGFEAGRPVYRLYENVWEFDNEYFEHDAEVPPCGPSSGSRVFSSLT